MLKTMRPRLIQKKLCLFNMRKKCFKCHKIKPLGAFYKHKNMADGHLNKCKECTKKDSIKTRSNNLEYYLEYDRQRASLDYRKKQREQYAKTDKGKENLRASRKKWCNNNKQKRYAHNVLRRAILSGKIKKEPCLICGYKNVHGHHEDYNEPLIVFWLCPKHHKERHKEI